MDNVRFARLWMLAVAGGVVGLMFVGAAHARAEDPGPKSKEEISEAHSTIAVFKKADPGLSRFFESSAGYVVFPSVGKGGFIVGGAGGKGVLFSGGRAVGAAKISQVTVGAQAGGQRYAEVIFFETPAAVAEFKKGSFSLAAQVSAVAAAEGASANAKYTHGVAVFTVAESGLMAEATVGGQKLKFIPFSKEK
jgi:lipid-binding SYLF domain-containing protein